MKQTVIGFILVVSFSLFIQPAVAQAERPAVIERLLISEVEVGRFLAQWYDQQIKAINNMKAAREHWDDMSARGDINQEDYAFVINRDITRQIKRIKQAWPQTRQYLKQTMNDIRENKQVLYEYSYSTSLGYSRRVEIRANGNLEMEEQIPTDGPSPNINRQTIQLNDDQLSQLKESIDQLQPVVEDVPPLLGQGFTFVTVYDQGEFVNYNHQEQPEDPARESLIELVNGWID